MSGAGMLVLAGAGFIVLALLIVRFAPAPKPGSGGNNRVGAAVLALEGVVLALSAAFFRTDGHGGSNVQGVMATDVALSGVVGIGAAICQYLSYRRRSSRS